MKYTKCDGCDRVTIPGVDLQFTQVDVPHYMLPENAGALQGYTHSLYNPPERCDHKTVGLDLCLRCSNRAWESFFSKVQELRNEFKNKD